MRTVRSAARARNRPRPRLAWLLLVALGLLLALAARAGAAPTGRAADDGSAEGAGAPDDRGGDAPDDRADDSPDELEPADAEAAGASALLRRELGDGRAPGFADAGELFDVGLRHQRPSRWGRLELTIAWRRAQDDAATGPSRRDELWLLASWSR